MRIEIQNNRIGPENAYLRFCLCVNDIRVCAMTSTPRLTSATVVVVLLGMLANCLVRGPIRSIRTSKSRREKGVVRYVFFFLPPEPKERTTDFFETAEREANGRFGGFFFFSFRHTEREETIPGRLSFPFFPSSPERIFLPRVHPDPEYSSVLHSVL